MFYGRMVSQIIDGLSRVEINRTMFYGRMVSQIIDGLSGVEINRHRRRNL